MNRRLFELISVAMLVMVVALVLQLAPDAGPLTFGRLVQATEASGRGTQAQAAPGQAEAPPAAPTPWGEADLQGIWTTAYEIPLQRPARFADQEFFTAEERAKLDGERARIIGLDSRRAPRGSEQDVGGAYSAAIFLSHKQTGPRTSLIVDPPDVYRTRFPGHTFMLCRLA